MIDGVFPADLANYNTEIVALIRRYTIFQITSTATGSTVLLKLCPTLATKLVGFTRTLVGASLTSIAMDLFLHHIQLVVRIQYDLEDIRHGRVLLKILHTGRNWCYELGVDIEVVHVNICA